MSSNRAGVVGPVEQRLALPRPAGQVTAPAVLLDLRNVPADRPPALNLPRVVRAAPTQEVPAEPLEPAARVVVMGPALRAPDCERLGRIHPKVVQLRIMVLGAEPGLREP